MEVPFEGVELQYNLHLLPGKPKAPVVIFIPGCDLTKEMYPDPRVVHAHHRGMHPMVTDGPGQDTGNLRNIKLTHDTFSPRYKQPFGCLTGAESEAALDTIVSKMTVAGRESSIKCPVMLTVGEYDARSPTEMIYEFYDKISAPEELWVYEDNYHQTRLFDGDPNRADIHMMGMDWLRDALDGKFKAGYARKVYVRSGGGGPNGRQGEGQDSMHWWDK